MAAGVEFAGQLVEGDAVALERHKQVVDQVAGLVANVVVVVVLAGHDDLARLFGKLLEQLVLDVYTAFEIVAEKSEGGDALATFKKAMDNVKPTLEVKPKRVGGATYQVPMEVNSRRSTALGIRWIVNFSRARKEKTMAERLANEILDASNGLGASVKKREDVFKMAEANRAFSHYRW